MTASDVSRYARYHPGAVRAALTRRLRLLLLLATSAALIGAVLPRAAAVAATPVATPILNAPFRGVTTPGSTFDVVQSVIDYSAGASSPGFKTGTPHYLSVLEGTLAVEIDGKAEAVVAGKGVAAPAGSTVVISNTSAQNARLFATTLLAVGASADVHQPSAAGVKVFGVARRTMSNAPAIVDVIQNAARYDVGYRTTDHVMNEFHLMLHLTGQIGYYYLDGGAEQYGPGSQAIMHEGHAGAMGNAGTAESSMAWTWVATPGKPLTTLVPAFVGAAPGAEQSALLVTGKAVSREDLVKDLRSKGCSAPTVAVLQSGAWRVYVDGAPSQVNEGFPASLAYRAPFFVRC